MQYGYPYYGQALYQQPAPMPQIQAQQQPLQQQQIRSGGIVSVSGEDEARRYPVAPGYTVTMRDDTGPYLYEKTMGFSQLDQPIFRKARIVFEDAAQPAQNKQEQPSKPAVVYAELAQLEALRDAVAADLNALRSMIDSLSDQKKPIQKKKEADSE